MKRLALFTAFILAMILALPTLASAADSAAAWAEFKAALSKASTLVKTDAKSAAAEVGKAQTIFEKRIASNVTAGKAAKGAVLQSLLGARDAADRGDALGLQVETELAEKSSLALFFGSFEAALEKKKTDEARDWFDIIAAQLKFPASSHIYKEMKEVEGNSKLAATEGQEIANAFTAKIVDKVAEEVDEAIVFADPKSEVKDLAEAQVKAAEGIGYFRAGEAQITKKLGFEDAARLSGLLHKINAAVADNDWATAKEAADVAKAELGEMETTKKLSGSALIQEMSHIQATLGTAATMVEGGRVKDAEKQIDEAWTLFTRVESQVRAVDASSYVKIEKIFADAKDAPESDSIKKLSDLFADVAAIKGGEKKAARASTTEIIFTTFERVQPVLFSLLALLGVYPVYLIARAFGWRHRAWRNIGIFIILLILPVFMEALGRLGVEMKIEALQALSFTVSEWAKMAWTVIVLAAFLFAISGLRAFCRQFGIKAFGVRAEEEVHISYDDHQVEVL